MTTERWNPQPGEPVVIIREGFARGAPTVNRATVQRLTKTLLILDNGNRYRLRDLTRSGYLSQTTGDAWKQGDDVYPVDHPNVPGLLNRARRERAISSAHVLARNLRGDLADGDPAKVIRAAAARLTELANIIEGTDQS